MFEKILNSYNLVQEIRIRLGKKVIVHADNEDYVTDITANREYIEKVLAYLTKNSVYAFQDEISNGYITFDGGNRAGICGTCVTSENKVSHIKDISSVNVRFAREFIGCADEISEKIFNPIKNTVIVSPPGCGKTTMLRDIARYFSYNGLNVSIVDERCEIAPTVDGSFEFDLGNRCDVMSNVLKSVGINMVLRAMNPDVIVVDEIAGDDDIKAVYNAVNSGVKIITSFHAHNYDEFKRRFKAHNVFECIAILNKINGIGKIGEIIC